LFGGWRQLGTRVVPILAMLGLFLTLAAPGSAVHGINTFELEGNAETTHGAGLPDDWDRVCHQVTITDDTGSLIPDQCLSATNTNGATAVAWQDDGALNGTIFMGGGSKDPEDIDQWKWKDGVGGLPDKDNLLHAFAARYLAPASSFPPGACGAASSCDVLYFGMDRFDNSGDAQNGFWFFKSAISRDLATGKFNGLHSVGDLLILSDFSNGGTTSTINIYKWVGSGGDTNGTLDFLAGGPTQKCGGTTDDAFCGIVNPTDGTTAPWSFQDKSGNNTYLNGEFYEGGINLSSPQINLGGECFASFASESRSSTSPTATLKDFVLGGFGSCTSSIASTQRWTPNDSATITVTGKADWTGTVTFTLYPNGTCNAADTPIFTSSAIGVADETPTASTSNTTAVNTAGTTTYSWKVFFDSTTTGVPDQETCIETTTLTIDNDTGSP
jgi:hypothetical protein